MKIAFASDHAGFNLKASLVAFLEALGHECIDLGPSDNTSVDYPDYGAKLGRFVASGQAERGIAICGSGIGISIAANKIAGIRAVLCSEALSARLSREHNDANILAMGERLVTPLVAEEITRVWLETPFEGGRHSRRVEKLNELD